MERKSKYNSHQKDMKRKLRTMYQGDSIEHSDEINRMTPNPNHRQQPYSQ